MADEEIVAKDSIAYKNAEKENEKVQNLVDQLGRDKSTSFPDPDFVKVNDGELEPKTKAQEIAEDNEDSAEEHEAKNPEPNPNPDGNAPDAIDAIKEAEADKPAPTPAPVAGSNGGPDGTDLPGAESGK